MFMDFLSMKVLGSALLPPLDLLLLAMLGLLLLLFRRTAGLSLVVASVAGLVLLSMPVVGTSLAGLLENRHAKQSLNLEGVQAIVILGAGSYAAAPEYGGDTVAAATLERLRWGARLHRLSGLPIMVSGGNPYGTGTSEAAQMKAALNEDFRTEVSWLEDKSFNTLESASYARQRLTGAKINRIALVTHAIHMRRARLAFEHAGFSVIEAPTAFSTLRPPGILNFLPSPQGLELSHAFLHEVIGLGWYHVSLAASGQMREQRGKQ
jgi:uncharacterized SAM-binding protein YcdF (DUF218 family)